MAAAALAHTIFFVSFTVGMGLVSAVAPLAAQAYRRAQSASGAALASRRPLGRAVLISLPVMALPFWGEQILPALGQSPAAAALAQQYLFGLALEHSAGAVVYGDPRFHQRGRANLPCSPRV